MNGIKVKVWGKKRAKAKLSSISFDVDGSPTTEEVMRLAKTKGEEAGWFYDSKEA